MADPYRQDTEERAAFPATPVIRDYIFDEVTMAMSMKTNSPRKSRLVGDSMVDSFVTLRVEGLVYL